MLRSIAADTSLMRGLLGATIEALLGATTAATLLAIVFARSVLATSCVPMEIQLKDLQPGTVVFVGTVAGRDLAGVQVRVDQWFSGADPRDVITIPLPGPNEPIIAGTWDPKVGERWFIVGDRTGRETVESNVCRQIPVDPNVVQVATGVFGSPSLPPFSPPDGGDEEPAPGLPIALGIGLVALGVIVGLAAVLAVQRRAA